MELLLSLGMPVDKGYSRVMTPEQECDWAWAFNVSAAQAQRY